MPGLSSRRRQERQASFAAGKDPHSVAVLYRRAYAARMPRSDAVL